MVKGMDLEEAYQIRPKDITAKLEGLPDNKIHCSVLGDKALREAINDYYRKSGMEGKIIREKETIVCQCLNVSDRDIEETVKNGAKTFLELQEATKISTGCGQCRENAEEMFHLYLHLYGE